MTDTTCEHYWFTMPDGAPLEVDSLVKEVCGKPATGRMMWLGARRHGQQDREVAVCDQCRPLIETQNFLEQADRDGTLNEYLGL